MCFVNVPKAPIENKDFKKHNSKFPFACLKLTYLHKLGNYIYIAELTVIKAIYSNIVNVNKIILFWNSVMGEGGGLFSDI